MIVIMISDAICILSYLIFVYINLIFLYSALCWYDREGIFASGAADDVIRLFGDDNESQVSQLFISYRHTAVTG